MSIDMGGLFNKAAVMVVGTVISAVLLGLLKKKVA